MKNGAIKLNNSTDPSTTMLVVGVLVGLFATADATKAKLPHIVMHLAVCHAHPEDDMLPLQLITSHAHIHSHTQM